MSDNSSPSGQGSKKPDFMVELIKRVQAMATDELPKQYEAQWGKLLESLESANWGERFTELLPQGMAIALAHWFVGQSLGPRERPGTPGGRTRISEHDLAIEVDPIRIDLSISLNRQLANQDRSAGNEAYTEPFRDRFKERYGLSVPTLLLASNSALSDNEYTLTFDGVEVYRGRLAADERLLVAPAPVLERLGLQDRIVTEAGEPAAWVPVHVQEELEQPEREASVPFPMVALEEHLRFLTPKQVVSRVLALQCERHARLLCSRSAVQARLGALRGPKAALVEELRRVQGVGTVHRVCQRLLEERVSMRPLATIVAAVLDRPQAEIATLTESVRVELGRRVTRPYETDQGKLLCLTLDADLAQALEADLASGKRNRELLSLVEREALWGEATARAYQLWLRGRPFLVVVPGALRRAVFELLVQRVPDAIVIGLSEVAPEVELVETGRLTRNV